MLSTTHFGLLTNCLLPAASTDAERAFSEGRREVNFMQHNMSSQTFKAEMAVGSWFGTPLMPNIEEAVRIIEAKMAHTHNEHPESDSAGDSDSSSNSDTY